jgi:hypothetical protein
MLKLGVAQTVVSKMEALLQQITTSGFCFWKIVFNKLVKTTRNNEQNYEPKNS